MAEFTVYASDLGNVSIRPVNDDRPSSDVAIWAKLYTGNKDTCDIVAKTFLLGYEVAEFGWEE